MILTNSKTQRIWVANSSPIGQELYRFLKNRKVQYHIHKGPPMVPILGQVNAAHILTLFLNKLANKMKFKLCRQNLV
jgi:hypothetical protein